MDAKQQAAQRALELVENGMVLGLGTGSTANLLVRELGRRVQAGSLRDLRCVPTSRATASLAEAQGLRLVSLDDVSSLDLTIDGADEVDRDWNLIKGGGGSLLREKIVAQASRRLAIMVDESKLVSRLGERWALPIEIVPFGWKTHLDLLQSLGGVPKLRRTPTGDPFLTDEGNLTLDVDFSGAGPGRGLDDPERLHHQILGRAGVVETGLFLGMTSSLVVGHAGGSRLEHRDR